MRMNQGKCLASSGKLYLSFQKGWLASLGKSYWSLKAVKAVVKYNMTASQLNPSYECGEGMKVKVVKWC